MTNADKRSVSSLNGAILKYLYLIVFFILVLDLQLVKVKAAPVESAQHRITHRKDSGGRQRRPTRGRQIEDEDEDEDDEDLYEETDYDELEFKPLGEARANPWESYMEKFDIPTVHGSGIYVDLGKNGTFKGKKYRMTGGKCPVFGKIIEFANGVDYLSPANDPDSPAFGFPYTALSGTTIDIKNIPKTSRGRISISKNAVETDLISPVTAKILKAYKYDGDDIFNCASYASELMMSSDKKSDYKYPFAYDMKSKTCHILYSSMQLIQGPKYCDNDGRANAGTSSLPCIKPIKDTTQEMVYGSSFIHREWKSKCPNAAVADAVFGTWNGTACVPIQNKRIFKVSTSEECGQIVFKYSASDSPDYESKHTEGTRLSNAVVSGDLATVGKILMPPTGSRAFQSKGHGFNWANYDKNTKECGLIDEVPNCLIFKMGNIAFNALGSPAEDDMEYFPCEIRSVGFITKGNPNDLNSYLASTTHQDMISNSPDIETLNARSCTGYYGKITDDIGVPGWSFNPFNYTTGMIIGGVFFFIILVLLVMFLRKRFRMRRSKDDDEALLNKYDEFEGRNYLHRVDDNNVDENDFWEKSQVRPSEVTPIRIERIEY